MKIVSDSPRTPLPLEKPALKQLAIFLAGCAAAGRPLGELTIKLVANQAMIQANRNYMGVDALTDVISFPHAPMPGEDPNALSGDIIVNAQLAIQEGEARGGKVHELALYIAHGLNHLAGGTDATPAQRRQMRKRELAWLKKARLAGLLPDRPQIAARQRKPSSNSPEQTHAGN